MNKSGVEYVDRCWNPVTGCLHDCPYCYARAMVRRWSRGGKFSRQHVLDEPARKYNQDSASWQADPYPFGFDPTFHRYRLGDPQRVKKPQTVFVCDMADLFGEWVPDSWIKEVFDACAKAPQHRYLFLTKNPKRYMELAENGVLPRDDNYWYGSTVTRDVEDFFYHDKHNIFISIEPVAGAFDENCVGFSGVDWVIIGADSSNRKGKIIPKREWVENIVSQCKEARIPIFLKNNLAKIWGKPLIQEYPWKEGES